MHTPTPIVPRNDPEKWQRQIQKMKQKMEKARKMKDDRKKPNTKQVDKYMASSHIS